MDSIRFHWATARRAMGEWINDRVMLLSAALAYFTGGVRIWDIREPQAPVEVAFYVPESNANTNPDGYMTNNVEIDDRGFIYVVDRNGAGLDILQLTGKPADIVFPARPRR